MTTATLTTRMTQAQIPESGAVLARAFGDDPLFNYILPDAVKRPPALTWFMTLAAKYGDLHGEVETTAGTVEGNAIWLPPGETDVPMMRMIKVGMLAAPFKFGMGPFMRFMGILNLFEKLHHEAAPEPHHYLMVLGVDPPRQGRGIGSALMAPVLARADASGVPCYLETQKEINVTLYRKHGFEVVVEDDVPKGGPRYWTMKRPPR
jgi:GNAT superfamily N-acetyltransferase